MENPDTYYWENRWIKPGLLQLAGRLLLMPHLVGEQTDSCDHSSRSGNTNYQ